MSFLDDPDIMCVDVSESGVELEEEEQEEEVEEMTEPAKKGRGQDTYLEEYKRFSNVKEFKDDVVWEEMASLMTRRKKWNTDLARKEAWVCKFSQRRGYKICKRQYIVVYPSTSLTVVVFHTPDNLEHLHEEDPTYHTKENYHWTEKQEAIVQRGIRTNTKISLILKTLQEEGATNGSGKYPDIRQVGVKKRYMKNVKEQKHSIVSAEALRQYCERHSEVPDDEHKSFVPYYHISGNTTDDLVMTVIWTTPKLMSRISEKHIQDDATYKLNWWVLSLNLFSILLLLSSLFQSLL